MQDVCGVSINRGAQKQIQYTMIPILETSKNRPKGPIVFGNHLTCAYVDRCCLWVLLGCCSGIILFGVYISLLIMVTKYLEIQLKMMCRNFKHEAYYTFQEV